MIRQTLRNRLHTAPRRWFAVLVVCWLNLVIIPCAMALTVEQSCPHAPAAIEQASGKLKNPNGDVAITAVSLPRLADYSLTEQTDATRPRDPVGFSPPSH